ncbi:hypothetical protein F5B21DRAFT_507715 [Xylaria acuta]|nr:hypothetical protein F5B21DRAFT_507715 [Xylaria acuta]
MAMNTTPSSSSNTTSTDEQTAVSFKDTKELLLYLYADLTRLSRVASPDIVLHPFQDPRPPPPPPHHHHPLNGIAAAQAHEEALVSATGGTLVMDVESVVANAHFGAVLGVLRARCSSDNDDDDDDDDDDDPSRREDLAVPFCGLWRFDALGRPVEHWENVAVDPQVVADWLKAARGGGGC